MHNLRDWQNIERQSKEHNGISLLLGPCPTTAGYIVNFKESA